MTSRAAKSSRGQRRSISESSNESASCGDEEERSPASASNLSSSDVTDLSGYSLNVDVEGNESPVMVRRHVRQHAESKEAAGTSCWHDYVDEGDSHTVTHRHTETMIRRPLHREGAARTKDSYIEYTSRCTVISKPCTGHIGWNKCLLVAIALICAISLVLAVLSFFQPVGLKSNAADSKSDITPEMFLHAFGTVRESFQVQTSGFWGVIRAAIKPIVLRADPDQPAVFVLVVPSDARETAECFTRLFSRTITSLFQTKSAVEFFTDAVSGLPPERVKRLLDDQLRNGLTSESRIAIVRHLEQLHGESAMMLHAYCDNENAPFRRAIFILALYVDEESSDVAETESFVEERLKTLWGDTLGTNKFYPLITRIAHSIVFMRPETYDVLAQIKC